jgi:hypothetical protein
MKKTTKRAKSVKVHGEGFSSAAEALESAKEATLKGKTVAIYEAIAIRDLPAKKQTASSVKGGTAACWIRVFPKGEI